MSAMHRYLVWIRWRPSGRVYYYCAVAPTESTAIDGVINGRQAAVEGSRAYAWPAEAGGPRVKWDKLSFFRLKDQPTIDTACAALGVVVSSENAAPRTPPRPAEGLIAPWRRMH